MMNKYKIGDKIDITMTVVEVRSFEDAFGHVVGYNYKMDNGLVVSQNYLDSQTSIPTPVDWNLVPIDTIVEVLDRDGEDWYLHYYAGIDQNTGYPTIWSGGRTSITGIRTEEVPFDRIRLHEPRKEVRKAENEDFNF